MTDGSNKSRRATRDLTKRINELVRGLLVQVATLVHVLPGCKYQLTAPPTLPQCYHLTITVALSLSSPPHYLCHHRRTISVITAALSLSSLPLYLCHRCLAHPSAWPPVVSIANIMSPPALSVSAEQKRSSEWFTTTTPLSLPQYHYHTTTTSLSPSHDHCLTVTAALSLPHNPRYHCLTATTAPSLPHCDWQGVAIWTTRWLTAASGKTDGSTSTSITSRPVG